MGRCRIVVPETVTLPLSEGESLVVKKELNAGEYNDFLDDLVAHKSFSRIIHYVIGWTLVGTDGAALPYSLVLTEDVRRETIRLLDKATVKEMVAVLVRHEQAEEAALEAKKKTPVASPASAPTSGSPAP